ncbi:hypothetical protein SAMN05216490_3242 [Mucilaginibacter mallensis]|uniref:Uncharacterized protein n=1 Tax=Mucilaginibacter mallensis TaxID=652787 RepID=A0A1H1ZUL8_MUCMA|nr:hypothetical protein SAMN05216490_3242 [Mucilaginibacter mallensis]
MNEFQIQLTKFRISGLNNHAAAAKLLSELFHTGSKNYDTLAYEIQREFKAGGNEYGF